MKPNTLPSRLPKAPMTGAERREIAASPLKRFFGTRNAALSAFGFFMITFALVAQMLPPAIRSHAVFNGLLSLGLGFYSIVALIYLRDTLRITFPIFILGLIQIWTVLTVFIGPEAMAGDVKLGRNVWFAAFIMMPYFAAYLLCMIDERWRARMLTVILSLALLNATVGILQFMSVPGIESFTNLYASREGVGEIEKGLELRSPGLGTHPYHLAAHCIMGMGIIASALLQRKLTAWEVFGYAWLCSALVFAQSRIFYIACGLLMLVTLYFVFRQSKSQFAIISSLIGVVVIALVVMFPDKLYYGLQGKNTIVEGRQQQWSLASDMINRYPVTGIGPNEHVFGSGFGGQTGRNAVWYTESGYRMMAVNGGYVGLFLLLLLVGGGLFLAVRVAASKEASMDRRRAAFAGAYYGVALSLALYVTNVIENELMTYFAAVLMALAVPAAREVYMSYRNRYTQHIKSRLKQAA